MKIISAGESPTNEGTAVFRVGLESPYVHATGYGRSDWTVGRIEIESAATGSTRSFDPGGPRHERFRREDFVVVYDADGNKRADFPRRNAILEYGDPPDQPEPKLSKVVVRALREYAALLRTDAEGGTVFETNSRKASGDRAAQIERLIRSHE